MSAGPIDGVTRHAPQQCPVCAKALDAADTFDGAAIAPQAGDWTCCAGCLSWLVYLEGFALRPVTNAEWLALSPDERTELIEQRERIRLAWSMKPTGGRS